MIKMLYVVVSAFALFDNYMLQKITYHTGVPTIDHTGGLQNILNEKNRLVYTNAQYYYLTISDKPLTSSFLLIPCFVFNRQTPRDLV